MGTLTRAARTTAATTTRTTAATTTRTTAATTRMRFFGSLGVFLALAILGAESWSLNKREPDYPSDEDIAEYLAMVRDGYHSPAYSGPQQMEIDSEPRAKRYGRFGNKYADNKSYGFWISALNKAGNYKRGKSAVPFVPAMSPGEAEHSPFQGYPDYSAAVELIPDKPVEKISHN